MASILEDGPILLNFLLQAMHDALPSPANLRMWGLLHEEICSWCGGHGMMQHALSACSVTLIAGRCRWWHNQALAVEAEMVQEEVMRSRKRGVEEEEANGREAGVVCEIGPGGKRWKKVKGGGGGSKIVEVSS